MNRLANLLVAGVILGIVLGFAILTAQLVNDLIAGGQLQKPR